MSFSSRNNLKHTTIQLNVADTQLRKRIFSAVFVREFNQYSEIYNDEPPVIEKVMAEMGIIYDFPTDHLVKKRNAEKLEKFIVEDSEWYTIFDFIEKYIEISDTATKDEMTRTFNRVLEEEVSGYRISEGKVIPVTNAEELEAICDASTTRFDSVNSHIKKALNLFADRKSPDYENSIKESISAVEAICCCITGMSGKDATLGSAIKKLKNQGMYIHPAMEKAFLSLYGYTSDENGIRHGGIDFKEAPAEDAKYMLITCSAFVNYLSEKLCNVSKEV